MTCPAKELLKFCHVGNSTTFPFLGWFYPYPRERQCCSKAALTTWAQSLKPGSQQAAGRQTRTQGLCLAGGFNIEERQPCNSNSEALHLISSERPEPGLFSLCFLQHELQPGSSAASMEQKKAWTCTRSSQHW